MKIWNSSNTNNAIFTKGFYFNWSYATFGTNIPELIQGAFWVQNGKNDGFTKMSVES